MKEICDAIEAGSLNTLLHAKPHLLRQEDSLGDLPLHAACSARHQTTSDLHTLETVETLARHYPDALSTPNAHGMLPLHLACWFTENALIRKLVELHPSALNAADENGYRPVSFVIGKMAMSNESWQDAQDLFHFILSLAPDSLWYPDQQGVLPLQYACWSSNLGGNGSNNNTIGERLLALYQQVTAAQGGLKKVVNEQQQTPVQVAACSSTRMDILQQLHKADPKAISARPDSQGKFPLHHVMAKKFVHHSKKYLQAKLEWLIEVDPTAIAHQDHQGHTPLHHLLSNPSLFYQQADANNMQESDSTTKTPAPQAYSFLANLLAHKDCTSQADRNDWMALACQKLANRHVCALADYDKGNLPLHLAIQNHSNSSANNSNLIPGLLHLYPRAALAETKLGQTALQLALQQQHQQPQSNGGCSLNTLYALVNHNPCRVLQEYNSTL